MLKNGSSVPSRANRVRLYDSARKVSAHVVTVLVRKARLHGQILDVGCGQGLLANYLAAEIGLVATGVDINAALIEEAARSDVTRENKFLVGDAADLPVSSGSFELVTCIEVLEHVENPTRVLGEISRALVPGGWLILSTPNEQESPFAHASHSGHKQHFTLSELLGGIHNAGFQIAWSGYRYHPVGAAIDAILFRVGLRFVHTTELDEHTLAVAASQRIVQRVILAIYKALLDPVVGRLVIREFTLKARQPGASLLVIARKRSAS